jgi:hypothetical protein
MYSTIEKNGLIASQQKVKKEFSYQEIKYFVIQRR